MKSAAKSATKAATKRFTKAAAKKSILKKSTTSAKVARKESQVLKSMDLRTRRAVKALFELKGYL